MVFQGGGRERFAERVEYREVDIPVWRRSALEGDVGRGDGEPFSTSCIILGIMRAFISVASVAEHRSGKGWNAGFWLQARVRVKVFFRGQRRYSKKNCFYICDTIV